MYVYVRSEPGLWTVGFYDPQGRWHAESDHDSPEKAAARVAWLNGECEWHHPPGPNNYDANDGTEGSG